jgi:hypothetical protein
MAKEAEAPESARQTKQTVWASLLRRFRPSDRVAVQGWRKSM